MGWLSRIAEFLSPLLSGHVIPAYIGLITYTNYRDNPQYTWTRYIVELPFYLLFTGVTALALWAIFGDTDASPFFPASVAQFPLPAAISFWALVIATRPGNTAASTVRAFGFYLVVGASVVLGRYLYGDTTVKQVEAVSAGIVCWTALAAARLYMHRNWRLPRFGLPIAFIVLIAMAFVVGYDGSMDKHLPAVIGLVLAAVATVLAFTFANATPLQRQIILTLAALAGGAIATEIPGFLSVDLSLGQKTGIAAGGALAVFIILYFWSAKAPRE